MKTATVSTAQPVKMTGKLTAANNAFLARVRAAFTPMFGVGDRRYYGSVLEVINRSDEHLHSVAVRELAGARWIFDNVRGMGAFDFHLAEEKIAECLGLPARGTCPHPECQGLMRASEYRDFRLSCCFCDHYEGVCASAYKGASVAE